MNNEIAIRTSNGEVFFAIKDLLAAIKERPAIWNKQNPQHHLNEVRERTWASVGAQVCSKFKDLNQEDQMIIQHALQKRWRNLRDRYNATRRARHNGGKSTVYVYDTLMNFLGNDMYNNTENICPVYSPNTSLPLKPILKRRVTVVAPLKVGAPLTETPKKRVRFFCPEDDANDPALANDDLYAENLIQSIKPGIRGLSVDGKSAFQQKIVKLLAEVRREYS